MPAPRSRNMAYRRQLANEALSRSGESLPLVTLEKITKRFGSGPGQVIANNKISLDIRAGRITALLGENGAGKSTLMSILAGRLTPDEGSILLRGEPLAFHSPKDAIRAGIGMVYQHFMLVESMTVAQNVLLGQTRSLFLSPTRMEEHVGNLATHYGLAIDPAARVRDLSMGEKQRLEILKLLYRNSEVLILDEPTAVLTPGETEALFKALRVMAAQGKAIVFISHKLQEVLDAAHDIAILRRGEIVERFESGQHPTKEVLASKMVGREVLLRVSKEPLPEPPSKEVLRVAALTGNGLEDVSLSLKRGEILAIAGVAGNGQKELVQTICGFSPPSSGALRILGKDWAEYHGQAARNWRHALTYIPEERQSLATCRNLDLTDNFLLTTRHGFCKGPFLDHKAAEQAVETVLTEHNVQPPVKTLKAWQLSGGNLQKLVLGRAFYREPEIIVAEQPTQGLDVAATEEVWNKLLAARETAGILLVTGDLNEAMQLADRVAVMYRGRIAGVVEPSSGADADAVACIGQLMAGLTPGAVCREEDLTPERTAFPAS